MLVVDMEMPKGCHFCPMSHWNCLNEFTGCEAAAGKKYAMLKDKEFASSGIYERPKWCPIRGEIADGLVRDS